MEYSARAVTAGLLLGLAAAILVGTLGRFGSSGKEIELVARQPAAGGWSRERIVVNQGERVRLRIRSEDVVHGFAIGRLGIDAGPIEPGKTVRVEFVADRSGEFTFYCTEWCDPNHPRMRGVLEVRGAAPAVAASPAPASDVLLQHLDDPRDASVTPAARPSAARGGVLYRERCVTCHGAEGSGTARAGAVGRSEFRRSWSPVAAFRWLGDDPPGNPSALGSHAAAAPNATTQAPPHGLLAKGWTAQERWDVVAYLWSLGATPERLELGQRLYFRNCAACHGETGKGDGPGGRVQPKTPADFTDLKRMLAGTSELYTAKIRRGGMGTGMPYWGSIFTEEELAAVVNYLWTFTLGRPQ